MVKETAVYGPELGPITLLKGSRDGYGETEGRCGFRDRWGMAEIRDRHERLRDQNSA